MESSLFLENEKSQSWVIGVSGGPDSMALLNMSFQAGLICHVVHVNYHRRESAHRDQEIVQEYCQSRGIDLELIDAPPISQGNFQAWARTFRYARMIARCKVTGSRGILVAHHQDDDLETFALQRQRKSKVTWYGLRPEIHYQSVRLVRPLLALTKTELIGYCRDKDIAYGIDESNLNPMYRRNRIRQELENLSLEERKALLGQKNRLNEDRKSYLERYATELNSKSFKFERYREIIRDWPEFLFEWLRLMGQTHDLSARHMAQLHQQIMKSSGLIIRLNAQTRLIKQYGNLSLIKEPENYRFTLESPQDMDTPYFRLSRRGGPNFEEIPLEPEDFPLTILPATIGLTYPTASGERKLSRWFITHKIPIEVREIWPVVHNAQGRVIFIPRCKVMHRANHNKKLLYMIK